MERLVSILILAVGMVICSTLIVATINLSDDGVLLGHKAASDINGKLSVDAAMEREMTSRPLSGVEVKYYAKEFDSNELGVMTINKVGSGTEVSYGIDHMNMMDSGGYVDPSSEYLCRIERSRNDEVLGVVFLEDGAADRAYVHSTAMASREGSLSEVGKKQYELFKKYRGSADACKDLVEAVNRNEELTEERLDAELDLSDSEVDKKTRSAARAADYSGKADRYQGYRDYYKGLAECVDDWTAARWYDPLIKSPGYDTGGHVDYEGFDDSEGSFDDMSTADPAVIPDDDDGSGFAGGFDDGLGTMPPFEVGPVPDYEPGGLLDDDDEENSVDD